MVKWTEVSAYSGMPVKEDAPTNATGAAVAGTGDDSSVVVVRKKKKKTFLDARTKAYKEHQKRLEACLLYTSPSPRDRTRSRMPSSA